MNTKTIFVLLFFSICINLQSQWQVINIDSSGSRFVNVCVVNQNIIWAVKIDTNSNICKSTNGGLNWQILNNLKKYIYYITAIDENRVWVSTNIGEVYASTNGGLNWVQQNYSRKAFINYMKFFNSNTGFFVADPVPDYDTIGFFFTRDGGANWIKPPHSPVNISLLENCINALDTNFIWICGRTSSSLYKFYSLKGGFYSEWHSYDYTEPGFYRNAIFKDSLNGLAASSNKIIITVDGGVSWNLRSTESVGAWIADFMLVPGTDWVIINSVNMIRISKDFGLNWGNSSGFGPYSLYYSDSKDTNSIWIAHNNGNLLKYNSAVGIISISSEIAQEFKLLQNFPNPFNPDTKIRFMLPKASNFTIIIYDLTGKEIYSITDFKPAGIYELTFKGTNYPSGIYFYNLKADNFSNSKKMILLK